MVMYPFRQPPDYSDLEALFELVARLEGEKAIYARPLTVMDRKTYHAMAGDKAFMEFRGETVERHSELIDAWCVDTCQMWYTGLGAGVRAG